MKQAALVLDKEFRSVDILFAFLGFVGQLTCYLYYKLVATIKYIGKYYWQHKIRFCTDLVSAIMFAAIVIAGNNVYQTSIESQIEEELINKIDRFASFKRDFRREVASDNSREFMNVGGPTWLRHVGMKAIITEARKANLSTIETAVLLSIADRESGFNPLAKAKGTTACGISQFLAETGMRFGLQEKKCFNPVPNTNAQVRHFRKIINQTKVNKVLQGKTDHERLIFMFNEVYCRHHDGLNMKLCSETAEAMTAKSLPMLFGSYAVLSTANAQSTNANFFYAVYDTLEEMSFWATSHLETMTSSVL